MLLLLLVMIGQFGQCSGGLLPGLGDTLGNVGAGLGGVVGGVGGAVGGVVGGVGGAVGGVVGGGVGDLVGNLTGAVGGVVGNVTGVVGGVVGNVTGAVGDLVGNVTGAIGGVVGGVVGGVGGVVGGVVGGLLGRCAAYTADGVTYANRCVMKDTTATCTVDATKPWCTCTAGWTDTYCTVDTKSLGNLGGNSSGVIDVINEGKNTPARLIASLPALLSFLTDEQRVQMSYTVDEMILDATYEEKALNVRDSFTLFNDPSLGNCFTYNHFNASQQYLARGPGARYGLRVTLDFQMDEYVPWVETVGIYTFVHPIGQDVYLESVKHNLPPGIVDQIAMKKYSFARMQNIFTHCAGSKAAAQSFYFAGEYSVDGCLRSCYQDSVYAACGCMDSSYARRPGVKSCNFEKLSCIEAMTAIRGDPYYWPECKCPLPCREEEYRYETSRALLMQSPSENSTTSDIVVYFTTLDVYAQVEQWTFPFSRVLGLTGGFAGVLLGASFVFCVEVCMLVFRMLMIGIGNLKMVNSLKMKKVERSYHKD